MFAFELGREILGEPDGAFVRTFAKALNHLSVEDPRAARLRVLARELASSGQITDGVAKRQIAKWSDAVARLEASELDERQVAELMEELS